MEFKLTQKQESIMMGKICPYCGNKSEYVDSIEIYRHTSYGMAYLCRPCDAYCGTYKSEPEKALGRLANSELRHWKKEAHAYFDVIWKEKNLTRVEAYKWLSENLNLPSEYTHIGMFSVKTCIEVVDLSKMILNDLRRLDLDFGAEVNRPHYER